MNYRMVTATRADWRNGVNLWARAENGDKVCFPCEHEPYFYVPIGEFITDSAIINYEGGYTSIFGDELKKVFVRYPQDITRLRDQYSKTFEADVYFPRNFLIDKGISRGFNDALESVEIGEISLQKVYLDIEVDADEKMPNSLKNEITCWCLSDGKGYVSGILAGFDHMDENENWVIFYCSTEKELLEKLLSLLKSLPDVLSGWNIEWDLEYLATRCFINHVRLDLSATCIADLWQMYKKLFRRPNYKLKSIALDEKLTDTLEEKVNYAKLWRENKKGLLDRNKRHVYWCVELDKKLDIISYYWQLKELAGLEKLEDTLYSTTILDVILLRKSPWILPTRSKHEHDKYEGAFVMNAPTGIFDSVCIYDVSAFYPSIVVSQMLDPKILFEYTKLNEGKIDWKNYGDFAIKYLEEDKPTITLGLVKELIQLRKELQGKPEHKTKLVAIKAFLNSTAYGALAYPSFRLYEPRIPARITEVARNIIQEVGKYVDTLGYKVLGSDTDSCMVQVPEDKHKELEGQINLFLETFGSYKVKIEHYYTRMLFSGSKKQYAGIDNTGKISSTGYSLKKSDSSNFTKEIQGKVIEMLLANKSKKEIIDYIQDKVNGVSKCKIEDIAITKSLGKEIIEYKTKTKFIKALEASKLTISQGEAFNIIPALGVPYGVAIYIDIEDLKLPIVIDVNEIIRTQIKLKVESLLSIIDVTWSEIEGQGKLL